MTTDPKTVDGFGQEWRTFDQRDVPEAALRQTFDEYFSVFPWSTLPASAIGVDVGCGSGRWGRIAAERAGLLVCLDPSAEAIAVATEAIAERPAVAVQGAAGALPLRSGFADFGYSLGVLHHTPDPAGALRDCVRTLKIGAPFLLYLYYAFDNRPAWFRAVWRLSDLVRRGISRLPFRGRYWTTQVIAATVYWPLARLARVIERLGVDPDRVPLSYYRQRPFYMMRNDALDRFGTRLELRFTRPAIEAMMRDAGLGDIRFREDAPFWCAVGRRDS